MADQEAQDNSINLPHAEVNINEAHRINLIVSSPTPLLTKRTVAEDGSFEDQPAKVVKTDPMRPLSPERKEEYIAEMARLLVEQFVVKGPFARSLDSFREAVGTIGTTYEQGKDHSTFAEFVPTARKTESPISQAYRQSMLGQCETFYSKSEIKKRVLAPAVLQTAEQKASVEEFLALLRDGAVRENWLSLIKKPIPSEESEDEDEDEDEEDEKVVQVDRNTFVIAMACGNLAKQKRSSLKDTDHTFSVCRGAKSLKSTLEEMYVHSLTMDQRRRKANIHFLVTSYLPQIPTEGLLREAARLAGFDVKEIHIKYVSGYRTKARMDEAMFEKCSELARQLRLPDLESDLDLDDNKVVHLHARN